MAILNNAIINGSARFIGDVYFNSIATATIASGDKLIIYDGSDPTRIKASLAFGTSTTTYLCNNGSWGTPAGTGGGSQGQRGSLWFTGTVSSFSGTGNVSWTDSSSAHVAGDIYLRSDTYNTYKCTRDANINTSSSWTYVCNIKGASGTNGTNGSRGTGVLKITTAPTEGSNSTYTISTSTLTSQSGVSSVLVGDVVMYSFYVYRVSATNSTTTTLANRVSIRGATGASGSNATVVWTGTSSAANYKLALKDGNNFAYDSTSSDITYNPGAHQLVFGGATDSYLSASRHSINTYTYLENCKLSLGNYGTGHRPIYIQSHSFGYQGTYSGLDIQGNKGIILQCNASCTDGDGLRFIDNDTDNTEYAVMYVPMTQASGYDVAGLYTNYVVPITGGKYSGSVTATAFYQESDINLKNVQNHLNINNSDVAKLPIFDFLWRDKKDENLHSGTSAQEVQKLLPTLVQNGSEGLVLDYATLGSILGINAARELEMLKKRVQLLEEYIEAEKQDIL